MAIYKKRDLPETFGVVGGLVGAKVVIGGAMVGVVVVIGGAVAGRFVAGKDVIWSSVFSQTGKK